MKIKALDKRNVRRTKMVVGLRFPKTHLRASDLLVHTLDISSSGASIGSLHEGFEPGSVLTVQRKHARANCRVIWSRQIAPGEVRMGIEFLGNSSHFWGLELDEDCAGVWLSASEC
jgi:hypothetical protein